MFKQFKGLFQNNLSRVLNGHQTIYVADVDKDTLWETYLTAFPEAERQSFNCNSCRIFIKNFGALVTLKDGQITTMWNFDADAPYDVVVSRLNKLVSKAPIKGIFVTKVAQLGHESNVVLTTEGTTHTWHHLAYKLPAQFLLSRSSESVEAIIGEQNTTKQVFKRALDELTADAFETVLDLIAQNSLYRGAESKSSVEQFLKIKKQYDKLSPDQKDNFCWEHMKGEGEYVARLRSTAMGTLLINISEGMDLDKAVAAFERIMAPSNYKRPNALITKKMVEEAEKKINELGLANSLGRRFATPEDVTVNNLLFVDRDAKVAGVNDIFGQLKESVAVNPKTLNKVEEVSVSDFLTKVLPNAKGLELLLENRHNPNFVSLIAPQDLAAPSLFKWGNGFSWSYQNALADSMKEKVKAAGGKVDGYLRVSLEWYNYDDLDLHLTEPRGGHISYVQRKSPKTGGELDVDQNAGSGRTRTPVENIIYLNEANMLEGEYHVYVNNFTTRERVDFGFNVEMEVGGELFTFSHNQPLGEKQNITVCKFTYSKKEGVKLKTQLDSKSVSKKIWGLDTNKFHKVSMIMKSPNHWNDKAVGNEHLFFILDGAHNDETVRGFFNEFVREDLMVHKRVFEALGSKMKVEPSDKQLSGVGFSTTTKGEVIAKVSGNFSRTIKIKF